MKIMEINGETALVEHGGVKYDANITLLDKVARGDYVIVHAGFAIQIVKEEDALETLKIFKEIEDIGRKK